jgi:hypothetical protein
MKVSGERRAADGEEALPRAVLTVNRQLSTVNFPTGSDATNP